MRPLVLIPSLLNRAACSLQNTAFRLGWRRPRKAPLPVISVGNITFGGSGKTPLVMYLVETLERMGVRAAVVTRGYRGAWEKEGGILSDGQGIRGSWTEAGDEPYMIALRFPRSGVFVGRDRLSSCRRARDRGFEAAVLDDGFQHRRLHRDLDLVIHDPSDSPALRESPSGLARADAVLVPVGPEVSPPPSGGPERTFFRVEPAGLYRPDGAPAASTDIIPERPFLAVAGIARPLRFRRMLAEAGFRPVRFLSFPDHYGYPDRILRRIGETCRAEGLSALITTDKDIFKLQDRPELEGLCLFSLRIRIRLEEAFVLRLEERLRALIFDRAGER